MHLLLPRAGACAGWLAVVVGLALAGCASAPPKAGGAPASRSGGSVADAARDGPEAAPPSGLDRVPDAAPRVESIRSGGPNKPYEILGREYVPFTQDRAFKERGLASWYGRKFQGRPTASGEIYDMYAMTAAHPTLPIPSYARVRNPGNGREIVVRVNDRGPFHPGRIIDLSYTAALKLDLLRAVAPVEVERITYEEIRAGTWRRGGSVDGAQLAARDSVAVASLVNVDATAGARRQAAAVVDGGAMPTPDRRAPISVVEPKTIALEGSASPAASATATATASATATEGVALAASVLPPDGGARKDALPAIEDAPNARALTKSARGFWVQLGAFRDRDGATAFQRRVGSELANLSPLLAVFGEAALFRLQAGPYPTREEARGAAEGIRAALQLVTVIVERR
jgi:rare lipoprotein A